MLPLILLPLGLDTLAVSLSLGIKSAPPAASSGKGPAIPHWLRSALLFSLAETLMPLVGLLVGYAASLVVSSVMHYAGALLLIGLGAWELWEEMREADWVLRTKIGRWATGTRATQAVIVRRITGARATQASPHRAASTPAPTERPAERFVWSRQLLLALSVSLDELAVGFSLGAQPFGKAIGPLALCLYIGIQGFALATLGIMLGRAMRTRLKLLKEASELVGAGLLIGLGIWLLFF